MLGLFVENLKVILLNLYIGMNLIAFKQYKNFKKFYRNHHNERKRLNIKTPEFFDKVVYEGYNSFRQESHYFIKCKFLEIV